MTEHYYWWWNGVKRLSRTEIRKMKENMQKTPLVQEKSKEYLRLEEENAEKLITSIVNESDNIKKSEVIIEKKTEKKLWLIDRKSVV